MLQIHLADDGFNLYEFSTQISITTTLFLSLLHLDLGCLVYIWMKITGYKNQLGNKLKINSE